MLYVSGVWGWNKIENIKLPKNSIHPLPKMGITLTLITGLELRNGDIGIYFRETSSQRTTVMTSTL